VRVEAFGLGRREVNADHGTVPSKNESGSIRLDNGTAAMGSCIRGFRSFVPSSRRTSAQHPAHAGGGAEARHPQSHGRSGAEPLLGRVVSDWRRQSDTRPSVMYYGRGGKWGWPTSGRFHDPLPSSRSAINVRVVRTCGNPGSGDFSSTRNTQPSCFVCPGVQSGNSPSFGWRFLTAATRPLFTSSRNAPAARFAFRSGSGGGSPPSEKVYASHTNRTVFLSSRAAERKR